jgi:hypothetical protein
LHGEKVQLSEFVRRLLFGKSPISHGAFLF